MAKWGHGERRRKLCGVGGGRGVGKWHPLDLHIDVQEGQNHLLGGVSTSFVNVSANVSWVVGLTTVVGGRCLAM